MSLRDKYTDEEWDAIPPFTGFHHNKTVEEMLIDKVKKENQPREVIDEIVDKVYQRRANNKDCEVAIMSISDYDAIQSMHDFKVEQIEVMGYKLKIHSSLNLEDGEIEIY